MHPFELSTSFQSN